MGSDQKKSWICFFFFFLIFSLHKGLGRKCALSDLVPFVQKYTENTHRGVLLLVKLESSASITQSVTAKYYFCMGAFHVFWISQMIGNRAKHLKFSIKFGSMFKVTRIVMNHFNPFNFITPCVDKMAKHVKNIAANAAGLVTFVWPFCWKQTLQPRLQLCRNQWVDFQCKSVDLFLCDRKTDVK